MTEVREPQPGELIGEHYVIEKEIGRGGFGVVFKARHSDIGRVVACKVLLATSANKEPSALERFRREATIAASLDYPNTVRVFDYGETDEGIFYIIMEFVAGKPLLDILTEHGSISPKRAVHILRQLLYALSEAHAQGFVHRDVKPENMMIAPLAYDPDFVKVMDFGIAKMVGGGESITQAGITLGTPRYMPVEQLKGQDLTPATDLYAAGLVLYEMLIGRPAFEAPTAVDAAVNVMQGPSLTVPPDSGIPDGLRAIIERACQKQAEDRYQHAAEFLAALDAVEESGFTDVPLGHGPPSGEHGDTQTRAMPEVDRDVPVGGDFEDATRTMALTTKDGRSVAGAIANTVELEVAEIARRAASEATPPPATIVRKDQTEAVSIAEMAPLAARGRPELAKPVTKDPTTLLVALNGAALLLLLVVIIKLFAG
jgi:serine/threonine protein kinase